jgi:hypothetical protein
MGQIVPPNEPGGADAVNLADCIKSFALNAVDVSAPTDIFYGVVKSVSPLIITVDQRFDLEEEKLILSSLVQNINVEVNINFSTENDTHSHSYSEGQTGPNTHNHLISGLTTLTLNLGLKVNEKVILLRKSGGTKYLILDRLR